MTKPASPVGRARRERGAVGAWPATFRTSWRTGWLVALLGAAALDACQSSTDGPADDATGGGPGSGGRRGGAGGLGAIDPDALAENCRGLDVNAEAPCNEPDLVCKDTLGHFCLCTAATGSPGRATWTCFNVGSPSSGGATGLGGEGGQGGADPGDGGAAFGGDLTAGSSGE